LISVKNFESWIASLAGSEAVLWVEIFLLVLTALIVGYVINRVILALEVRARQSRTVWDDALLEASRKPAVWLVWILGVNFAVGLAARKTGSEWYELIIQGNRLAVIFLITLFLLNLIKRVEANFLDPQYTSDPVDETTLKAISKLLRISVIITAVLIALQLLGYSISGVLAFGGIGGLAVGFAAKDLLANFFGGLMIYLDRPFSVGEWVRSPDQEIEGTVEDIGWRLTRIRTFDKRPLYVPNAVFNTIALENPSRMHNRRIKETVGVRYCDMDSLKAIVNDIRQMLEDHDEIDNNQTLIVNFNQFAASSLDIMVYCFTKTTQWVKFHEVKEDVLCRIADIIASHDAEIAFPTSTVHLPDPLVMNQPELQPQPQPQPKGSESIP